MDYLAHQRDFEIVYKKHPLYEQIRKHELDESGLAYKSPTHKIFWWLTFENIFDLLCLSEKDRLLDVGVGFGFDEKVIKQRLPEIELFGIDISPSMIHGALLNETPAELAVATGEELPLPDNVFTRILSREVIEHVVDRTIFLNRFKEVATEDAVVVITTPNADSLTQTHLLKKLRLSFLSQQKKFKDEHLTPSQLEELFAACGFQVQEHFFDCAAYFWLGRLSHTRLEWLVVPLIRITRCLEGHDLASRLMCDQVKYALKLQGKNQAAPPPDAEISWRCPKCKGQLRRDQDSLECLSCTSRYVLMEGKAPLFLQNSISNLSEESKPMHSGNMPLRQLGWILYSLFYLPFVLTMAAIVGTLRIFGRSAKPYAARGR